jgi:hypothetical protein
MPTLVLVHIGSHFPEYINDCIRQIQHTTNISIHVLIRSEHRDKLVSGIELYPLEDIPISDKRQEFERNNCLDSTFRNGFWKYAMMRFFYIYDHVVAQNLDDIFHIENDNLIYVDFMPKLSVFQSKPMWCVMDAKDRCIPSFLYFKNHTILRLLLDTCIECATHRINDMYALSKFKQSQPDLVGTLPIIKDYCDSIHPDFYQHADDFGFLFDAAAVGQYIGGVDPRNDSSNTIGFINETCVVKCDKVKLEWNDKYLYVNTMPLVNVHIHSKDLKRWSSI